MEVFQQLVMKSSTQAVAVTPGSNYKSGGFFLIYIYSWWSQINFRNKSKYLLECFFCVGLRKQFGLVGETIDKEI